MNRKIILISVLSLVVLSGVVFAFQKNRQSEKNMNNKSLLEDFSDGGLRSAQNSDKNYEVEDLKNYSPQTVLVDEIISSDNDDKKQKFGITQYLNFFTKIGGSLLGIEREVIFQPINKIIELRKNTKIPRTIKVPEEYISIQLAIDNAEAGDMVEVAAGEYKENIIIKEGVSVIGEGILSSSIYGSLYQIESGNPQEFLEEENKNSQESYLIINKTISSTILDGENSGNVVSFKNGITDKTKFAGFTIKNSGENLSGILIENSSPLIYENFITDNKYGIYIKGVSSPTIQKNIIRFASKGIQVYNFEGLENSAQDDKIDGDEQNDSTQEYEVSEKELKEDKHLFSFNSSSLANPVIIDNLITDNKIGIDLYQSSAIIDHNTISYNNHYKTYLGATYGIYLSKSSAEIKNNIITDSGICELCSGINANKESKNVVISYNNIWNNKNNFVCFGECAMEDNNLSEDPNFIDYINGDYRLSEESGLIGKAEEELDIGIRW